MSTRPRRFAMAVTIAGTACAALLAQTSSDLYFPGHDSAWAVISPNELGWGAEALDETLRFAQENNSTALVILYKGRIAVEKYWSLPKPSGDSPLVSGSALPVSADGRPIEDVASVQKSVLALLVGVAVERGLVELDAPVDRYLGSGWSRASLEAEHRITIRHLMSMTSGLDTQLAVKDTPGARWFYNTPAYSRLITVLAKASGLDPNQYLASWLGSRLGLTDTRWRARPAGGQNPYGLTTTARDLARIGLLVLAGGTWVDTAVVPKPFVMGLLAPSQRMNPSYGLLWWNNAANGSEDWDHAGFVSGPFIPTAPRDLYAARGAGDHKLYVVPSMGLVVTRLGTSPVVGGKTVNPQYFDRELWGRLGEAVRGRR